MQWGFWSFFVFLIALTSVDSWTYGRIYNRNILKTYASGRKKFVQSQDTLPGAIVHDPNRIKPGKLVGPLNEEVTIFPLDYVVHNDYGIGQVMDSIGDEIHLCYAGHIGITVNKNDRHKLFFWMAADEASPSKLSPLTLRHKDSWSIKSSSYNFRIIKPFASQIINSAHQNKNQFREPYPEDSQINFNFETTFQHTPTNDQLKCFEDVRRDMMRPYPMDRVIFGETSAGKKEAAIRAAYRVILKNKQVAFLSPTANIAFKNYHMLRSRMPNVSIHFYRGGFLSSKHSIAIRAGMKDGRIQIIVGTSGVLGQSNDAKFHDLGLIVCDEEDGFRISPRDSIKSVVDYPVDCLCLTALPCPSSLRMSLTGMRDYSFIKKTYYHGGVDTMISVVNSTIVEQAIRKEMRRKGQVYLVVPDADQIYLVAARVKELIRGVKVAVAQDLMGNMLDMRILNFVNGSCDVLMTTAAPEVGLNIPRANTIIVFDSHRLKLAELHKCRQQVGRSNNTGFAHFLLPNNDTVSDVAFRRLQSLKELKGWDGYHVASRENQMRGATTLIGRYPWPRMAKYGVSLFVHMLRNQIDLEKGTKIFPVEDCDLKMKEVEHILTYSQNIINHQTSELFKSSFIAIKRCMLNSQEILNFEELWLKSCNKTILNQNQHIVKTRAFFKVHLLKAYARQVGITEISFVEKVKETNDDDDLDNDSVDLVLKVPGWTMTSWNQIMKPFLLKMVGNEKSVLFVEGFKEVYIFEVGIMNTSKQLVMFLAIVKGLYMSYLEFESHRTSIENQSSNNKDNDDISSLNETLIP